MARELRADFARVVVALDAKVPENKPLLGFIVYWLVHDELQIMDVATAPAARRRGVGRALMQAAEVEARARKCSVATLEARVSNTPAVELYKQLGYEVVGRRPRYYEPDGEDALVMTKPLA
jgi:ribosomal-protein-alanine N-acetyltransferase